MKLRGSALPLFSLTRPVTVVMMFVATLVLGFIANARIPLELMPSGFALPFFFINVVTLRAAPADVEKRVAIPVEEMLATVRNVNKLNTEVRPNSVEFFMEFQDGTNMDVAYNQVVDRIERVMPTLGDDARRYFVWKYNPANDPVVWFAITLPEGTENPGWIIQEYIEPKIERLPGVSNVELFGAPERSVSIRVDDRQANAAGLGLYELIQRLSRDNFTISGGEVEDGGFTKPLRIIGKYDSLGSIENLAVGNGLTLENIADVGVVDRSERAMYRVNGRPGIFVAVFKESTANTVDVARSLRELVSGPLKEDERVSGANYHFFFDQGEMIEEALYNLKSSAYFGAILAIVILWIFLRRVSLTIFIAASIPSSMVLTIAAMYFTGRSMNLLSLTGLMISVGMVVDNSIVVVEAIQSKLALGMDRRKAALYGTAEVSLAIIVSTMTTIVVFLPIILMDGGKTMSYYLAQIGFPVCVSLAASLLVSLVFMPIATAILPPMQDVKHFRFLTWMQEAYGRLIAICIRRRLDTLLLGALVLASTKIPMKHVSETDSQDPNFNDVRVFLTMPETYSWEEKSSLLLEYEAAVLAHADELGIRDLLVRMGGPWGGRPQLRAFLTDPDSRTLSREDTIKKIVEILPHAPGVANSLEWDSSTSGTEETSVQVSGPDSATLGELAIEVARRLRTLPGVTSVQTEADERGEGEVQFRIDPERSNRLGLSSTIIGATVDFALRGRQLGEFRDGNEALPIYIEGDVSKVDELSEVRQLQLPSAIGDARLDDVSATELVSGYRSIQRENRRTIVNITVSSSRDDLEQLAKEINATIEGMRFPRGYRLELGNRFAEFAKGQQDRVDSLLMAAVFVFLLMGVLFESVLIPFAVILSVPFAFTGVYWMLYLTKTPLDAMAGVGLVILIGVVVNNGIVLIDSIVEKQRDGMPRNQAVIETAEQRLRPILMTAATTIFGLIPMATGTAALIGIPYSPMGRAIIGGMVASTLLTLFIVPLVFTLLDDMRLGTLEAIAALRKLRTKPGAVDPAE